MDYTITFRNIKNPDRLDKILKIIAYDYCDKADIYWGDKDIETIIYKL